jgi:hypothetical protein
MQMTFSGGLFGETARIQMGKTFVLTLMVSNLSGRSQWSRGLKHEVSSSASTLKSWVRIPLEP